MNLAWLGSKLSLQKQAEKILEVISYQGNQNHNEGVLHNHEDDLWLECVPGAHVWIPKFVW